MLAEKHIRCCGHAPFHINATISLVIALSQVNLLFETDTFEAGGAELATIDLLPRHLSKPCLLNKEPPPVAEAEFQDWVLNGERWTGERLREMAMDALRACRGVFKDAWDAELKNKADDEADCPLLSGDTIVDVLKRVMRRVHFNLSIQRLVYNKNERDKSAAKKAAATGAAADKEAAAPTPVVAQSVFDWMHQKTGRSRDTWMEAVLKEFGWFDPTAADCGLELMEMPEFFEGFKFMVAFTSCAFPRAHSTSLQSAATLAENLYLHGAVLIFGTPEPLALFKADLSLADQGAETPGTAFQSRRDMKRAQQEGSLAAKGSITSQGPAVASALSNGTARVERALLKTAAIQQQSDANANAQQHAHNKILTHNAHGLDKQRMIDTAISVLERCPPESELAKTATLQLQKFFDEARSGAELADPSPSLSPERIVITSSPSVSPGATSSRKGPSTLGSSTPKVSQETDFTMDLQGLVGSSSMGVVLFGEKNMRQGQGAACGGAVAPKARKPKAKTRALALQERGLVPRSLQPRRQHLVSQGPIPLLPNSWTSPTQSCRSSSSCQRRCRLPRTSSLTGRYPSSATMYVATSVSESACWGAQAPLDWCRRCEVYMKDCDSACEKCVCLAKNRATGRWAPGDTCGAWWIGTFCHC